MHDEAAAFPSHDLARRSADECGRGTFHTNMIEGCFSIFKRGMTGVYQHRAKTHLHRSAAAFEFRCNNRPANGVKDAERGVIALAGAVGKRLTKHRRRQQV
jgi:hypothetical protein